MPAGTENTAEPPRATSTKMLLNTTSHTDLRTIEITKAAMTLPTHSIAVTSYLTMSDADEMGVGPPRLK